MFTEAPSTRSTLPTVRVLAGNSKRLAEDYRSEYCHAGLLILTLEVEDCDVRLLLGRSFPLCNIADISSRDVSQIIHSNRQDD